MKDTFPFAAVVIASLAVLAGCDEAAPSFVNCPPMVVTSPGIRVTDGPDGGVVPIVEAVLGGESSQTQTLQCDTGICSWPRYDPVVPGIYSLQITAPYFQSATIKETLTTSPCGVSTFDPDTVAIDRL